jgi:hypothetical protein
MENTAQFVLFTKYYWSGQIKEDEMGGRGDNSTKWGDEKYTANFSRNTSRKEEPTWET